MNMFLYKCKYKYVQLFSFPIYKSVVGHGSGNQTPVAAPLGFICGDASAILKGSKRSE